MDLRIMGADNRHRTMEELNALPLIGNGGVPLRLDQTGGFRAGTEPSKLYRKNRQKAVFFSLQTPLKSVDEIEALLWRGLNQLELPEGYAFEPDDKLEELDRYFRILWGLFLLALLLIYLLLGAERESVTDPLIILAVIPLSLSFPLTGLFLMGKTMTTSVLIGFIVLTGMVVNNAILIVQRYREISPGEGKLQTPSIIQSLEERMPPCS